MLSMIVLTAIHAGLNPGLSPFTLCVAMLLSPVKIASNKKEYKKEKIITFAGKAVTLQELTAVNFLQSICRK